MTSASYPVGSNPASSQGSFLVHLQSLTDISHELQTQVDGIAKPLEGVASLLTEPPALGPFAEATTLTTWSHDAAAQMQGLISDVRAALEFADEVTRTVATGYARADDDVRWGITGNAPVGTVVGTATSTAREATAAVGGLAAGLTHTATGVVDGVTHTATAAVDGVTHAVGQVATDVPVGSIVGALTGGARTPGGLV